ncbi:MAG: caspase family protein [Elusimicrobia bacterium]|nr:caspase family protein [Elusimicrobiota bacterium]
MEDHHRPRRLLSLLIAVFLARLPAAADAPAAPAKPKPEFVIQMGHTGTIFGVRLTPNGRFLLTAGQDNSVKLWDAKTGVELRTYAGHTHAVESIALFPGGKAFASAGGDAVKLWRLADKRPYRSLYLPAGAVAVAVSPDGALVAAASPAGEVCVWNAQTGQKTLSQRARGQAHDLAFSPDGLLLAVAGGTELSPEDNAVELWDLKGKRPARMLGGELAYQRVVFSRDGSAVAGFFGDGGFRLWKTGSGEELFAKGPSGALSGYAIAFSPDSRLLAVAGQTGVELWDWRGQTPVQRLEVPRVTCLDFSADGKALVAGTAEQQAHLWDLATGDHLLAFGGGAAPVASLAASADGRKIIIAAGSLTVWDLAAGSLIRTLEGPVPTSVACADDSRVCASGGTDGQARLWDVDAGQTLRTFQPYGSGLFRTKVESVSLTPDGKRLLTRQHLGRSELFDAVGEDRLASFPPEGLFGESVDAAALSPDGAHVATAFGPMSLALNKEGLRARIWNADSGTEEGSLKGPVPTFGFSAGTNVIEFSPDNKLVASGGFASGVFVWDRESRKLATILDAMSALALRFDRAGRRLLAGGMTAEARLFELPSGRFLRAFMGHNDAVTAVDFIPGTPLVVTGSRDGTARLWSTETGRELCRLITFQKGWVAVTPDGYYDGSPEGLGQIRWTTGFESFPLDAFSEGYYSPGLLARIVAGGKVAGPKKASLAAGFALPPEARIVSPADGARAVEEVLRVSVEAEDRGGGVDEIRLFHNGKALSAAGRDITVAAKDPKTRTQTFAVELVDGENVFQAVGISRDRIEGNPARVSVFWAGPGKTANLHVLAVGINEYQNPALNLNYARPDAQGLAAFFRAQGGALFGRVDVRELYDSQATKPAIMGSLAELESIPGQDVVVVYLAGHGDFVDNAWYFVPAEVRYPEREEEVKAKAVSSAELLEAIRRFGAKKVVVLMDACKSGGALPAFASRGFEERKALYQLGRAAGVHVIAASGSDQLAGEVKDLGHGAFTYLVLEALNGAAAPAGGGAVTVKGLESYVENRLPELSRRYRSQAQLPTGYSLGNDFPIGKAGRP